ncbi:MAG: hypothetical protein JOZ22_03820 [Acidobacteriia bacterium]|nr:hypothetical protein [Terriglobia bacterium]
MRKTLVAQPFRFTIAATAFLTGLAWGQNGPNSGLQYLQNITIPGWKTTGAAGNANVDLMGYNPVTRMMYLADRTNNGIDVIDTRTNVVVGLIKIPANSPPQTPAVGPNGVLVAINLQQLIVTDGQQTVYVWDLRAPQAQPDTYTFPTSMGTDTDGVAYDPINETVYIVTDNPPEYLIGINLAYKKIVSQTPLPVSSDLIAFNPTDGKIYIAAEDADNNNNNANAGVWAYDPASGNPGTVTQVVKVGPACPGHGIDIDPVSVLSALGCFGGMGVTGVIAVILGTGSLLGTFTNAGGTDAVVFNPNLRRFYLAAGLNSATNSGCPQGPSSPFGAFTPVVGIVDENAGSPSATVACSGGGHIVGVDPITNYVYVPVSQYPASGTATAGANGVLVFRDTTPPRQAPLTQASAPLTGLNTSASGTVHFALNGRRMHMTAGPMSLPSSAQAAWLTVPTTVTNEFLPCAVNTSNQMAVCSEDMLGDPLIGATVTLSTDSGSGGVPAARGVIGNNP